MKKKDKLKLDSISNIDEKLIDEATDLRISLSERVRRAAAAKRKRIISIACAAACFVFVFALFAALIGPIIGLGNTVPVYQGMTIRQSSVRNVAKDPIFGDFVPLGGTNNGNGNAYGHDKDNHKKDDDKPKNDIEDIVVIDVKTDDEVKYYVKPGETFIIEIHIDNPKDYEIQSFTLNGQKYANYMFEEGSTMELLLLEVTAPSEPGYVEYTIDAIKYIDGTEIKDVDMSEGDKSIKAGIAYPTAPSAAVTSQSILPTSIELSVNIADPYKLIGQNELAIYLSDDENIVSSKPLTVGVNNITFDDLSMNKTYEYGIVTAYDLVDGKNLHKEWLLTNTITTAGAFGISNATSTQDSISFEINKIGTVGEITSISIFDAETNDHVASGGADIREFTGLLSNHTYNLYVDFKYTLDGEEIADWVAIKGIKTAAKTAPNVTFGEPTSDKTAVSYSVDTLDPDGILNIQKVELLLGGESVKDNGVSLSGKFDELLSNNTYTIKVTYTYDLNDGQGVITENVTKDVTTVAKVEPTVTFSNMSVSETNIVGNFTITDADNIGSIASVDIYKQGTWVKNNPAKEISFTGLDSYTDYKIAVTYTFDLNDGAGLQTKTAIYDFNTAPHLEFESCKILNTNVIEGDTVYIQIALENPSGATPQSVIVNGQTYICTGAPTLAFAEIKIDGQFEGGNTTLTIEKVNFSIDGSNYFVTADQNNTASLFINSKLEVKSMELAIKEGDIYVKKDYIFPREIEEDGYALITLSNKTGYTVDSVELYLLEKGETQVYDELIKIDNEHYALKLRSFVNIGINEIAYTLQKLTYHNEYVNKTLSLDISSNSLLRLHSDTVKEISTPEDLLNMNDGYYYSLINDIDLSGLNWEGSYFYGVFDGNGYSIKNFIQVGTATSLEDQHSDSYPSIGLFKHGHGIIKNVNMKSITLILDCKSYSGNIGALVGYMRGTIDNCHVDADSVIRVQGTGGVAVGGIAGTAENIINSVNFATIDGTGYVGGIAGNVENAENCKNYGSISGTVNLGGIAGSGYNFKNCENHGAVIGAKLNTEQWSVTGVGGISASGFNFVNCKNHGAVSGTFDVGGITGNRPYNGKLIGCANYGKITGYDHVAGIAPAASDNMVVQNCANYGIVTGELWVGGILGKAGTNVEDCANFGKVSAESAVGGISGDASMSSIFSNCISVGIGANSNGNNISGNASKPTQNNCYLTKDLSTEQLNSKSFYTDTLGWSEDIWNLDDLDIENGKYPTLR